MCYESETALDNTHSYDRDAGMFFLEASHMCRQFQGLLIVAITHTGVHQLRHLQDL